MHSACRVPLIIVLAGFDYGVLAPKSKNPNHSALPSEHPLEKHFIGENSKDQCNALRCFNCSPDEEGLAGI